MDLHLESCLANVPDIKLHVHLIWGYMLGLCKSFKMTTIIYFTTKYDMHSPELFVLAKAILRRNQLSLISLSYLCLKLNSDDQVQAPCGYLSSLNNTKYTYPQSQKEQKEMRSYALQSMPHLVL